jgi:sortase A
VKSRHWLSAAVPCTAAFFSLCLLANSAWIPVKAEVAQWLIERSWEKAQKGEPDARPWPWADTRAEALLLVPGQNVRQVVLAGNSARNLAFGPVLTVGTERGPDRIISGHRDTHFRFLQRLRPGDLIRLDTRDSSRWFEVRYLEVVDSRRKQLVIDPSQERISLVTCYPFDRPMAGGPLRYVVTAVPAKPVNSRSKLSSG